MATRDGGRENGGKSEGVGSGIVHEILFETMFNHRRVSLNAKAVQALAVTVSANAPDSPKARKRSAATEFDLS